MNTTNVGRHFAGFEDTVRDFWASRPRRPHHGRKLAGVAAGVGARYGIDPTVVRVAFVVLAVVGGVGVPLYVLGWLVFAEEGDAVSGAESLFGGGHSSMSRGFALLLCILMVPLLGWAMSGSWVNGGFFIGLALVVAALYLLHRSRGQFRRPAPVQSFTANAVGAGDGPGAWEATGPRAPHTWDPLGAEPLGWRLSTPAAPAPPPRPVSPEPRRRKSKVGFATAGVALAVAGVGTALAVAGEEWFSPGHVIGMVLAVLGLGMAAGSFLGGGRGLLWLAVPLSMLGLAVSSMPSMDLSGGFGPLEEIPRTPEAVQPLYERTAGDMTLDLTQLNGDGPVVTSLNNGAGNITVFVPENADVTYHCEVGAGDTQCLGHRQSGLSTGEVFGTDLGPDGRGGREIDVMLEAGVGNVEVHRE